MFNYNKTDYKQQVEIMRRCTANALDGSDIWIWSTEYENWLKTLFFSNVGITLMANYANCPETEIMKKIMEMDLYNQYDFPILHLNERAADIPQGAQHNIDPYALSVELLRRSTPAFHVRQFVWTKEKVECLREMFYGSEGITKMALVLGCTEPMVMEKILEEHLYFRMNFPLFSYNIDESEYVAEEIDGEVAFREFHVANDLKAPGKDETASEKEMD